MTNTRQIEGIMRFLRLMVAARAAARAAARRMAVDAQREFFKQALAGRKDG